MGMRKALAVVAIALSLAACGGDDPRGVFEAYAEGVGITDTRALADAVCADDSERLASIVYRDVVERQETSDADVARLLDSLIPLARDAYCPNA